MAQKDAPEKTPITVSSSQENVMSTGEKLGPRNLSTPLISHVSKITEEHLEISCVVGVDHNNVKEIQFENVSHTEGENPCQMLCNLYELHQLQDILITCFRLEQLFTQICFGMNRKYTT